ncbi:MAG: hypothetical protein Q8S51_10770 [Rhodoferax sp.]|uniref:hypothetical protein n=1 Tax=Rhodoferax sp. TaxID=50421 RepID=UPI002736F7E5|nr:hypothetical protein [Rhodoferax sp.]MDP3337255.1 hypothetical protein [Rhodoferax sp.]
MQITQAQFQKNLHALAPYDLERLDQLRDLEIKAIARFKGNFDDLEAALGVLHLGDHLGWKPLVLIHNKRTIRKFEEILEINIREFFPEEGPSASRSIGYKIAKKIGSFWKAVSGEVKDDELKIHRRSMG